MFPLSRPARQGLATAALAILTVLPTGVTAFHAWRINRPGHVRDVEITLGRQLGLQVTLEAVTYPQPGEILYRGIVLRQEEPRGKGLAEVARAKTLHLIPSGRELVVHAEELAIRGEGPEQGVNQLGGLLQRSGEVSYDRVALTAPTCRIELGPGLAFRASDLAATLTAEAAGPTLRASYRLVEPGSKTRCELTFARDRRTDPVQTTFALKTLEGRPLPARVLNVFFDATDWVGEATRVDGRVALRRSGEGAWEGEFSGELHDVDLAAMTARRFPGRRLAGKGTVSIEAAKWGDRAGQGAGWVQAQGKLVAGPGTADADLLSALTREMKFRPSARHNRLDPRRREVEFSTLGLGFEVRPDGEIRLSGALGHEHPPDAVLAVGTNALVHAPEGASSVHGLIKALVASDARPGVLVPLTPESRVLLCLPTPQDAAPRPSRTMGAN